MIQTSRKYGVLTIVLALAMGFSTTVASAKQPENYMGIRFGVATPAGDLEDFDSRDFANALLA